MALAPATATNMPTTYRVVRTMAPQPWQEEPEGSAWEVVWQGTDPSEYMGGIGCYDEHCGIITRYFERCDNGAWVSISDPRSKSGLCINMALGSARDPNREKTK